MSDERQEQETVSDIMSEMREYADSMEKHDLYDLRECATDYLRILADRIEDAVNRKNRTIEKSSAVGNSAAKHQFREVAKMIPHEEVTVAEMQQPLQPVADCHGLNAEKMREALEQIHELLSIGGNPDTAMCIRYEAAYLIAKEAISAPPRNCDVFSKAKVLEMLEDRSFSKEDTIEWLFDEAKGETDGSK